MSPTLKAGSYATHRCYTNVESSAKRCGGGGRLPVTSPLLPLGLHRFYNVCGGQGREIGFTGLNSKKWQFRPQPITVLGVPPPLFQPSLSCTAKHMLQNTGVEPL